MGTFTHGANNRRESRAPLFTSAVFTQVRTHNHKQITKIRYKVEKLGRFVFGKPVFSLLGLTTPYSLGIFV